jgi:membrane protease YdiL (CAAX protease family)
MLTRLALASVTEVKSYQLAVYAVLLLATGGSLLPVAAPPVGAIWIVTDPVPSTDTPLGVWIASLPIWIAILWIVLRAIGAIILIPVAEELAFRGYLHRALISFRFETVRQDEFRLLALAVSSLAPRLQAQSMRS